MRAAGEQAAARRREEVAVGDDELRVLPKGQLVLTLVQRRPDEALAVGGVRKGAALEARTGQGQGYRPRQDRGSPKQRWRWPGAPPCMKTGVCWCDGRVLLGCDRCVVLCAARLRNPWLRSSHGTPCSKLPSLELDDGRDRRKPAGRADALRVGTEAGWPDPCPGATGTRWTATWTRLCSPIPGRVAGGGRGSRSTGRKLARLLWRRKPRGQHISPRLHLEVLG